MSQLRPGGRSQSAGRAVNPSKEGVLCRSAYDVVINGPMVSN